MERDILQDPTDALLTLPEPMLVSSSDTDEDDANTICEEEYNDKAVNDAALISRVIERTLAAK